MDMQAMRKSYARWAPVYDLTFGAVTSAGRRRVAGMVNARGGALLEVGVGTGMSLDLYNGDVRVTGIDASPQMLAKAEERVLEKNLTHVAELREMDARHLGYGDDTFDHVAALHIMSVVPEPERVMAEMARVLKPGGSLFIVNHFAREKGFVAMAERLAAPLSNWLGWHSDFDRGQVLGQDNLKLAEEVGLPPFGLMTLLRLTKRG
jgi:phosphatidylethanolamine/phosphatidyl-N-methylethanolamine N-methyltransferase